MSDTYFSEFGTVLLFLIGGAIFISLVLIVASLIRPSRPNPEKLAIYECGEEPSVNAWGRFNIRFYVVALIFILFDVEIVFLFPWATIFGQRNLIEASAGLWGWYTLVEMIIFIGILAFGLAYAWKKRLLEWDKQIAKPPVKEVESSKDKYQQINEKYHHYNLKEVKRG